MESFDALLRLRIMIATLGEGAGWWESSFLNETNMKFLAFAFPRAPEIASLQGAVEAARRVHDERIGSKGVIHLFRQPHEVELAILEKMKDDGRIVSDLKPILLDKKDILTALAALSGEWEEKHEGPVQIHSNQGMHGADILKKIAAIYLWAFENDKKAFPYVLSAK